VNKNHPSTFHGVIFLFHTYGDFFMTDAFQKLKAIKVQEQKTLPNPQHGAIFSLR